MDLESAVCLAPENVPRGTFSTTTNFGYDLADHINRVYLQDKAGTDSRAAYFYYDSVGLNTLRDADGSITYFNIYSANTTEGMGRVVSEHSKPAT